MADEPKPPQQKWYHTAPGYLTATAALVGSITAAVTGLSQLGRLPFEVRIRRQRPSRRRPRHRARRSGRASRVVAARGNARARAQRARTAHAHALTDRPRPAPAPRTRHVPPQPRRRRRPHRPRRSGARTSAATAQPRREDRKHRSRHDAGARERIARVQQQQQRRRQVHRDDGDAGERQQRRLAARRNAGDSQRRRPRRRPCSSRAKGVSIDVAGKTVPISGTATAHTEFNAAPSTKGIGLGRVHSGGRASLAATDRWRDGHPAVARKLSVVQQAWTAASQRRVSARPSSARDRGCVTSCIPFHWSEIWPWSIASRTFFSRRAPSGR